MTLTPLEFIQKEFQDFDPEKQTLPPGVWMRKMQEYSVLTNAKIDLEHLLKLDHQSKCAMRSAVSALYFNDNSDYKTALYQVVHHITQIKLDDLNEDVITSIFYLFEPA